ncbi:MAG: glycoside hydrolase family 127 protein [Planctomycetota bacterium]
MSDVLAPADPATVRLEGFLGRRYTASAHERLPLVDEDELLAGFERRPGSHPWIGEHVGKWLHAACLTARATGDAALRAKIERVAQRLMATQEADGYLGTYAAADRFALKADADWDVWVHKYAILGLLCYHELTGDRRALEVASRAGDLLGKTFGPGGKSLITAGTHMGMAATSVLEPIVLLHRATGAPRFLDFARAIVAAYQDPGGPDLLARLAAKTPLHRVANAKAYEMLSNVVGLCELYRTTGDHDLLAACVNACDDVARHRIYPTGGASSHELFQADDVLPRGPEASIAETCVTTTWIQLNTQLLRLTGEARFADEIERSAYNHLLAAQRPTGEAWCYYTPLEGRKPYGNETSCCLSSGPRALALLPTVAVMASGALTCVNLFESGHYDGVAIATRYPYDGKVVVTAARALRLGLRLPAYAGEGAELLVNGQPAPFVRERGYAVVAVQAGDRVALTLPFDVRLTRGRGPSVDRVFVTRGPLVYALGARLNPTCGNLRLLALASLDPGALAVATLDPLRADVDGQVVLRAPGRCRYPLDQRPQELALELTDFAHTGTRLDAYEVALLAADGSASCFAMASESWSRAGNVNGHFNDEDQSTYRVTYDGSKQDVDWFALTLSQPSPEFDLVVFHHGATHHDGGWFDASVEKPWLELQRTAGGEWQRVAALASYPDTTATDPRGLWRGEAFSLRLAQPQRACGIRVVGHPARGDQDHHNFASCAELKAMPRGR